MSHVATSQLHGYKNRGIDIRVDVDTESDAGDFSSIIFRVSTLEKSGLSAASGGDGVVIDFTITAAEMETLTVGKYPWECLATLSGEVRSVAQGLFRVDPEPTTAP